MHSSKTMPALPISAAAAALASWVTRRAERNHEFPAPHRAKVRVRLDQGGPLAWLRAQPVQEKLFFRDRSASFEVAAAGFLECARGGVLTAAEHDRLASLLSDGEMRMYGALRFDDGEVRKAARTVSGPWAPYEGYIFVLPAVELIRDASGTTHLAVNMLRASDAPQLLQVLRVLCPAPRVLHSVPAAFMMPSAQTVENTVDFADWDAQMGAILQALRREEYQKIVLARGKRFTFDPRTRQDPVQILAALDESNNRRPGRGATAGCSGAGPAPSGSSSYLFCLQLDETHAFLGCTPERLFRLQGNEVLTNAIAGTVRRDSENEEALLRELWGRKNVAEHNFVIDHIRTALNGLGARVCTSPTRVLPLPRLMHLSTKIVGVLDEPGGDDSENAGRVFRLLKTMHPTPAVCGMPRERTLHELARIEKFDRGLFAGPFGWFSRNESEFCVAIRSAIVSDNTVTAFAGSGIVKGSESRSEWEETELKMSAFTDLFVGDCCPRLRREKHARGLSANTGTSGNGFVNASRNYVSPPNGAMVGGPEQAAANSGTQGQIPNGVHTAAREIEPFDPTKLENESNLNALWACASIEELCRNGIGTFFVAPGSRSAPLAVAVVRSPHAKLLVVHDERSAGFLAVGYARATGRGAAIITSSGTAVANLLPAVVEAHNDNLPMILLTADRPPELRDISANQTINQVNIFGNYVRWFIDMPCPTDEISLRKLLSDVDQGVQMSGSLPLFGMSSHEAAKDCGPVHLNYMFREYLAPIAQNWNTSCLKGLSDQWKKTLRPVMTCSRGARRDPSLVDSVLHSQRPYPRQGVSTTVDDVHRYLEKRNFGVIVVGGGPGAPLCEEDKLYIYLLAEELEWPVVADVGSGVRLDNECSSLISFADQMLVSKDFQGLLNPAVVLQFGERLVSKRTAQMISRGSQSDGFVHILVSPRLKRCDQGLTVTHRVHSCSSSFLRTWCGETKSSWEHLILPPNENCSSNSVPNAESDLKNEMNQKTHPSLSSARAISLRISNVLTKMMSSHEDTDIREPWLARCMIESISYPCALYVGNSMPIRDVDMFACGNQFSWQLHIGTNRGASGIDGVVSSGIGFGLGLGLSSVIVVGDMSLLHDLNALHFLRPNGDEETRSVKPVTIVVVNNSGGAIFSMLPIAKFGSVFSPVFDTPHSVRFSSLAELFHLEYIEATSVSGVRQVLSKPAECHRLVEVFTSCSHQENADLHKEISSEISKAASACVKNTREAVEENFECSRREKVK